MSFDEKYRFAPNFYGWRKKTTLALRRRSRKAEDPNAAVAALPCVPACLRAPHGPRPVDGGPPRPTAARTALPRGRARGLGEFPGLARRGHGGHDVARHVRQNSCCQLPAKLAGAPLPRSHTSRVVRTPFQSGEAMT